MREFLVKICNPIEMFAVCTAVIALENQKRLRLPNKTEWSSLQEPSLTVARTHLDDQHHVWLSYRPESKEVRLLDARPHEDHQSTHTIIDTTLPHILDRLNNIKDTIHENHINARLMQVPPRDSNHNGQICIAYKEDRGMETSHKHLNTERITQLEQAIDYGSKVSRGLGRSITLELDSAIDKTVIRVGCIRIKYDEFLKIRTDNEFTTYRP